MTYIEVFHLIALIMLSLAATFWLTEGALNIIIKILYTIATGLAAVVVAKDLLV